MPYSFAEIITSTWKLPAAFMATLDAVDCSCSEEIKQRALSGEWTLSEWASTNICVTYYLLLNQTPAIRAVIVEYCSNILLEGLRLIYPYYSKTKIPLPKAAWDELRDAIDQAMGLDYGDAQIRRIIKEECVNVGYLSLLDPQVSSFKGYFQHVRVTTTELFERIITDTDAKTRFRQAWQEIWLEASEEFYSRTAAHISFGMCSLSVVGFAATSYLVSPLVGGIVTLMVSVLNHYLGKSYFSRVLNESGKRMLLACAAQAGVEFHKGDNYSQRLRAAIIRLVELHRKQILLIPHTLSDHRIVQVIPAFLSEKTAVSCVPDDGIYQRVKAKRVKVPRPVKEARTRPIAMPKPVERVHWDGYPDYTGDGGEVVRFTGGATGRNVYGFFNRRRLTGSLSEAEYKKFAGLVARGAVVASWNRSGIKHLSPPVVSGGQECAYEIKKPSGDARVYGHVVTNPEGACLVDFNLYREHGFGHS